MGTQWRISIIILGGLLLAGGGVEAKVPSKLLGKCFLTTEPVKD